MNNSDIYIWKRIIQRWKYLLSYPWLLLKFVKWYAIKIGF